MKNLSRVLFILTIIILAAIITADKCQKSKVVLKVESLDESVAKVIQIEDTAVVYVLETKVFGKAPAMSDDYAGYKKKGVLKDIFRVVIDNASTGIIFSNPISQEVSSMYDMSAKVAHTDQDITPRGDFASTNLKKVVMLSSWFQSGFVGGMKKPAKIGMMCSTPFDTIAGKRLETIIKDSATAQNTKDPKAAEAAKERLFNAKEQLTGRVATCAIGGSSINPSDYKGWAAEAETKGKDSIKLIFGGANLYENTLGYLFRSGHDLMKGNLTPDLMRNVLEQFDNDIEKVTVKIVSELP